MELFQVEVKESGLCILYQPDITYGFLIGERIMPLGKIILCSGQCPMEDIAVKHKQMIYPATCGGFIGLEEGIWAEHQFLLLVFWAWEIFFFNVEIIQALWAWHVASLHHPLGPSNTSHISKQPWGLWLRII